MRDKPAGVSETSLAAALAAGWGIEARSLSYRAVGAGSYHWSVRSARGETWWARLDGIGLRGSFDQLSHALRTAFALRHEAGLPFVVAPLPGRAGALFRPVESRYALSVYPVVDGVAGDFGAHPPGDRAEVAEILIALHGATPAVAATARRTDLRLPGRVQLHAALHDLAHEWTTGPYSAPARALLADNATTVERWLADFDDLARRAGTDWVVTHGEPHPGNFLRTAAGLRLIDWDTVLLAPPERDLWMVEDAAVLDRYADATGRAVNRAGLDFYRLWWKLADVAVYVDDLRRPHGPGGDAADALACMASYFNGGAA